MKLALFINDIATEKDYFTTIRLSRRAIEKGHEVALVGLENLIYRSDGTICALASCPSKKKYADDSALLHELQDENAELTRVNLTKFDVILLRSDPADEVVNRPWAPNSALLFAQLLVRQGVIVLNDPGSLTDASNKTYFQTYPDKIRPRTVIAHDADSLKKAVDEFDGKAAIKPLQGSGGQGVFIIKESGQNNLNQIIEATVRDGYAIVQEYLPLAAKGDIRLFTLNGKPLKIDGVYACFRRYNDSEDARSNFSAGGKIELIEPDKDALAVAEAACPKLVRDGMYLAGLDIVGDKMMEINVDTPGGVNMADDLIGKDFSGMIIDDLERKVRLKHLYGHQVSIRDLAAL